jgi:tetratricopeptide (TPR) repeat protein
MKWCAAIISIILLSLVGCAHVAPPLIEYTLADTAIKAAKAVQAVRYSPGKWHEAEEAYRQARILYNEREYEQAIDLFNKARIAAEKAENSARLTRMRNGEVL